MALFFAKGNKYFAKAIWIEKGEIVPRRLVKLTVVAASGISYPLVGKDLPDGLIIQTGPEVEGKPAGTVLLSPKSKKLERLLLKNERRRAWFHARDIMFVGAGVALLGVTRMIVYFATLSE